MPPFVGMIFSKAGGLIALGVVIAVLSLGLYIEHLRLAASVAEVDKLTSQIVGWKSALNQAASANDAYVVKLQQVTADRNAAVTRANDASVALAAARATVQTKTETIIKEITNEKLPGDDDPVSPDRRALLGRLFEQYGPAGNSGDPSPAGR